MVHDNMTQFKINKSTHFNVIVLTVQSHLAYLISFISNMMPRVFIAGILTKYVVLFAE